MFAVTTHSPTRFQAAIRAFLGTALLCFAGVQPLSALEASPSAREAHIAVPETHRAAVASVAADYYFGDGLNNNHSLRLTNFGTFTYELATYEGPVAQVSGRYEISGQKIVLRPSNGKSTVWPQGMADELFPVAWGERVYLVPANDLIGFTNAVNSGAEPITNFSHGRYLLREGDVDREVAGKPQMPEGFGNLVLDQPVEGRVVQAKKKGHWRIGAGKKQGLQPGMELCAVSPDQRSCVRLRVVKVDTATAIVEELRAEDRREVSLLDWKFSSRMYSTQE